MQGRCLTKNNVYQATVVETTVDNLEKVETYVGVCATTWKERYRNHIKSFNNLSYKGDTILSRGERILFFGPNTNNIRNQNFDRIRMQIIFVFSE